MKRKISPPILSVIISALIISSCCGPENKSLTSPDGKIKVTISLSKTGEAAYTITFNGQVFMTNSPLGIVREDTDFSTGLSFDSVSEITNINDSYQLLHGKKKLATYEARKRVFHLSNKNKERMDIIFQVSNDGVAFCYYFPGTSEKIMKISAEKTGFNFTDGTTAWIQPRARAKSGWNMCNPSYEEHYLENILVQDLVANDSGWVMPALFHAADCWIAITESWPDRNYCGSRLQKGTTPFEMIIAFPEPSESFTNGVVFPESTLPWTTPWRIITMGNTPGAIMESTLGTDLAKPSVLDDVSYVKPGRASWSWVFMKDPSVNFETQKEFIDYASEMGWEYCLVDVGWDTNIGWDKMSQLAKRAASKNVGLIVWYNSSGDWNTVPYTPKDKLLTAESRNEEFAKLKALGIKGIKVDFFGGDGQSMMDYYQDILIDAHKYQLMVNCHGSTYPRGLARTYPNLVSMEAIRGLEYATFGQETADKVLAKAATVPFTRNAFDPMDFTPVCFNEYDNNKRITGNGAELAQAIILLSGVQHYGEIPSGMAKVPDYVKNMMREIPVSWDETKYVAGFPASYLVLARRTGTSWYVAGINAEIDSLELPLHLPFISSDEGMLITEGDSLRSFGQRKILLDDQKNTLIAVKSMGGFVIKFN